MLTLTSYHRLLSIPKIYFHDLQITVSRYELYQGSLPPDTNLDLIRWLK